ncbi:hypothetical protein NQ314_002566 [Rhamnusium bicolor]|uniref:Transferrin-like domain-containing protein n=1 Tax=Rhamnusium bicolor TaxID=1586634 RepID=A0AAV8ZQK7_9CUCU|nr:hypothetical protein NQ314_002566 [Rhamnusium bicolor]
MKTSLSVDTFQLLCKDGSRKPISEYLTCNWGKVPSDAIVTSSAVPFEAREKFQKFLQKFAERYPKRLGNYTFSNQKNNYGNNQPEYDQFGNKGQPNYDQLGNKVQPEYDQFGNRNRYKRQSFGNLGSQENRNNFSDYRYGDTYRQDDSYNQNNPNQPRYNQYDGNYQYGSNNYGRDDNRDRDDQNDYSKDRYINPYRTTERYNQNNDLYPKDPHSINPDKYGINIDPYDTDIKYNKPNDPVFESPEVNGNEKFNVTNATFYEVFSLFESIPRYGEHGNLMFQVNIT